MIQKTALLKRYITSTEGAKSLKIKKSSCISIKMYLSITNFEMRMLYITNANIPNFAAKKIILNEKVTARSLDMMRYVIQINKYSSKEYLHGMCMCCTYGTSRDDVASEFHWHHCVVTHSDTGFPYTLQFEPNCRHVF